MGKSKYRGLLRFYEAVAVLFLIWAVYTPVPYTYLKFAAVASIVFLMVALTLEFRAGRWICLSLLAVLMTFSIWPYRPVANDDLRGRYIAALLAYKDTPYVWGGENGRGIDCSGLMRRAMVDAFLSAGWDKKNPSLWRQAVTIWWNDCSAREMKNGYSGQIQTVQEARSLNLLDTSQLHPGDLAILKSGVHVLAFVKDKTWIQADPDWTSSGHKVVETTAPSSNGWFSQRVVICRWKSLA